MLASIARSCARATSRTGAGPASLGQPSRAVVTFASLRKPALRQRFDAQEYDRAGLGRIEAARPTATARCIASGVTAQAKLAWPTAMAAAGSGGRPAGAQAGARLSTAAPHQPQLSSKLHVDLYNEDFADGCWLP